MSISQSQDSKIMGDELASEQQRAEVQREVAAQTEALLRLAHVLRLQPLTDAVHSFIYAACVCGNDVLDGVMDLVFTDAVLEAALGGSSISKEVYIISVLSRPASFASRFLGHNLFCPLAPVNYNHQHCQLAFHAQLLQDFVGCSKGEVVHVCLDLFGASSCTVTSVPIAGQAVTSLHLPAHVLLGCLVDSPKGHEYVMKRNLNNQP
jgi:hypothetical protein